jgi:hypothetical protein
MYFKNFPQFLYDFDIKTTVGNGTQAVLTADLAGQTVGAVNIVNGGSGYVNATITFSAPQTGDLAATAFAVINSGVITDVVVTQPGTGYASPPFVTVSAPFTHQQTQTKALALTDITRNIRFRRDVLANVTVYDYYDIVAGETPEIVAEKVYGNAQYHWIVMLANERYDYLADWPLTQVALDQFVSDKYGDQSDAVHHYIDYNGYKVSADIPGATSVSNRQYEDQLNESKRSIKIISIDLISTIIKNFKDDL